MIVDHNNSFYRRKWDRLGVNRWNGAFYYSKEIVKNIIPNVATDRNWITINIKDQGCDHSIVFIHNNLHPEHYDWLSQYEDLVLVCGVYETQKKLKHLGKTIYLPLSVDVDYVESFSREKTKDTAFVGRPAKKFDIEFPEGIEYLEGLPRTKLLPAMAEFRNVYAVGRTAIEAKVLGCRILPYDPRFPNPRRWKVLDNLDAAKMLQQKLDKIDK